ncbi:response regulator receiver domain-containing protein [Rhizobium sp. PP-F2F-G48]|uniref:response regulator n=1 Tax=Rhizobium sp. PP-F2F-G48 TaxID=2135651 RepID=UPI00104A913B|nr:response regulator [Rhizobium sp. PP-F2F-G48]TCM57276.1 response regulator receiver domain-containing protein [Rhizobium sp. PP-F2F-G48]
MAEQTRQAPVLVVEDDGLIRMDLADILADMGLSTVEAANADQALKVMDTLPAISALMTDIDMPGSMNGIALAHRTALRSPTCPLLIISGRYNPADGTLPDGAVFLSKPISESALRRALVEMGLIGAVDW